MFSNQTYRIVGCSSGKTLSRDGTAIVPSVVSIHPFGNLSDIDVLNIVLVLVQLGFFRRDANWSLTALPSVA